MIVAGQSQSQPAELPMSTKMAKPGGLLPRLIALIVDSLILLVILLPIMALWVSQLTTGKVETGAARSPLDTVRGSLSLQLTLLLLQVFYFAGTWTIMAATPGQLLMNLRVTDANAAGIGFARALFRYLLFALLLVLAPVSALMVGLGKQKRSLHDLLAGTYVIQIVDREDLGLETALPPAFSGSQGRPPRGPRPGTTILHIPLAEGEVDAPAPYSPPNAQPTYSASATPAALEPTPSPGATDMVPPPPPAQPSAQLSAEPPPLDFPAIPARVAPSVPPPPRRHASGGGMDADLYSPPQMVESTSAREDFVVPPPPPLPPPAPPEREIYSPQSGRPTPPPAPPGATDTEPPREDELSPVEYPPMAPPPDQHS